MLWNGDTPSASGSAQHRSIDAELEDWYEGIIDGAGLAKQDPRLLFRRVMFNMARKQAGQVMRRRETREHVTLYLKAFNAWTINTPLTQLKYTAREPLPPIANRR